MQDILDCLYEYVYEHRLPRLLNADPAYLDAGRMEDRAEECAQLRGLFSAVIPSRQLKIKKN